MAQEATQTPEEGQAPPEGPQDPQPKTFDEDYVKSLRAEAAKHRKEAAEAKAKAQQLEDAQLSETDKLKRDAEEGRKLAESATSKLRNANLRDALAEKGYTGPHAKAVAKLLSDVEFDADDEPKNLDARLTAAASDYGDLVKPAALAPVDFDGGPRDPAPPNKTPEQAHQDFLAQILSGRQPT